MKRILLAACLALALPGLSGCSILSPPRTASQTVLDEKLAISAELAFQGAARAVELAVDAGLVHGEKAEQLNELRGRAFNALAVVRAAYAAQNAAQYLAGLAQAKQSIDDMLIILGRSQ